MNQYDKDARKYGWPTAEDQRREARNAEIARKREENAEAWQNHADEFSERVKASSHKDAIREQQMREYKRKQEAREAQQKEKAQAQAQAQEKAQALRAQQSGKPAQDDGEWSTAAAVFGFIASAIWASGNVQNAEDSTLMIITAGVLGGVILGRFYQTIIGTAVVIFILMALAGGFQ